MNYAVRDKTSNFKVGFQLGFANVKSFSFPFHPFVPLDNYPND